MTTSMHPRKQRKYLYNAPLHKKRKWISSHLAENLLLKYDRRNIPVIKGDTVKVMRGSFRGHEDKIAKVHVNDQTVEIEGIMITKADGKKLARPMHPSTLLITKLNLTDKWRRQKLERGLTETARKDIEREAAEQIKDLERQKVEEERRKKEEEEKAKAAEEPIEEIPEGKEEITKEPTEPPVPPEEKKEQMVEEPPCKRDTRTTEETGKETRCENSTQEKRR